jgi:hypothetical protein
MPVFIYFFNISIIRPVVCDITDGQTDRHSFLSVSVTYCMMWISGTIDMRELVGQYVCTGVLRTSWHRSPTDLFIYSPCLAQATKRLALSTRIKQCVHEAPPAIEYSIRTALVQVCVT